MLPRQFEQEKKGQQSGPQYIALSNGTWSSQTISSEEDGTRSSQTITSAEDDVFLERGAEQNDK